MLAFADGAADVLVCTTIIESGLDIPNANTIVIDRADTLGLAQLYQLRGRVGRSSRRRLRLPPLPAARAAERRGAQAAPGDLQRVGARCRLPDRPVRPRDPRRREHPRRRAVGPHGGRRVRPLLAAAGRRGRGEQGAARGPRAGPREARRGARPAGRRPSPRRLRPRRGPEARALPPARAGPDDGRHRRVPPGGQPTGSGRCQSRSPGWSRSPSSGWRRRPPASRRSRARTASSSSASVRGSAGRRRCASCHQSVAASGRRRSGCRASVPAT